MRILLTGASGLVGGAFAQAAFTAGYHITGTVGAFSTRIPGVDEQVRIDLGELAAVRALVKRIHPQAIVNASAISEPARCETEPELSDRINVALPAELARLAAELGARLIHLSSEQVFAGDKAPYAVTDPVSPINRYARQKVESEQRVHAAAADLAVTLRAPLLMGNSPGGRRSLHERLFADWSAGRTPRLYVDEFRQTCTAENLADAMLELCNRADITGIFHWAGADLLSRHEQGLRVRAHFGLSETRAPLAAVRRADDPVAAARRQANLGLNLSPLAAKLRTPVQTFDEQLAQLRIPAPYQAWAST
jgi:dTDP-4-dehydrorhamnose reductase